MAVGIYPKNHVECCVIMFGKGGSMNRMLLKKSNYSNLLLAALGCFFVVFILLGFYLWSNSREPDPVENYLLTTKGKFLRLVAPRNTQRHFLWKKVVESWFGLLRLQTIRK